MTMGCLKVRWPHLWAFPLPGFVTALFAWKRTDKVVGSAVPVLIWCVRNLLCPKSLELSAKHSWYCFSKLNIFSLCSGVSDGRQGHWMVAPIFLMIRRSLVTMIFTPTLRFALVLRGMVILSAEPGYVSWLMTYVAYRSYIGSPVVTVVYPLSPVWLKMGSLIERWGLLFILFPLLLHLQIPYFCI